MPVRHFGVVEQKFRGPMGDDGGGIEADLTASEDRRLQGSIVSQLDVPLNECMLLFGRMSAARWVYPLRTSVAGQEVQFEHRESHRQNASNQTPHLAARTKRPYDRATFDVARIVELMMFHERAGATNYTGLLHRYQSFIDLSKELELGRAILVGRGPGGAMVEINRQGRRRRKQPHFHVPICAAGNGATELKNADHRMELTND